MTKDCQTLDEEGDGGRKNSADYSQFAGILCVWINSLAWKFNDDDHDAASDDDDDAVFLRTRVAGWQ